MTIQECYEKLQGNYAEAESRLMNSTRITKYTLRFLKDDTFTALQNAVVQENRDEMFRLAHTLKGVAQNMSFTKLGESSSALTEALRPGSGKATMEEAQKLFVTVEADYKMTRSAIEQFDAEQ